MKNTATEGMSPSPLIPPLEDNAYLISLIADVTGAERSLVTERLRREHLWHPHEVQDAYNKKGLEPYVWSQGLLDFYEETDSFIYELVVWNRSRIKCDVRMWMLNFLRSCGMPHGRILISGDGLGVDSFFFARAGYDVVSCEISRYGKQLAGRLYEDYDVNVQMVDTLEALEPESFDAIFSLDVLEHVPSPQEMVRDLSKLLRPAGLFVMSAPFYNIHPKWPTHLKANRKYSGRTEWLSQAGGLKWIDGCVFGHPMAFQKMGDDSRKMFSMSLGKYLTLGFGQLFLRFSSIFPALIG